MEYGRLYMLAQEEIPHQYRRIGHDPMKGMSAALYAKSFVYPVMPRTANIAMAFQRQQRTFLSRVAALVDNYNEGQEDGRDGFYESRGSLWRRLSPFMERDLSRG